MFWTFPLPVQSTDSDGDHSLYSSSPHTTRLRDTIALQTSFATENKDFIFASMGPALDGAIGPNATTTKMSRSRIPPTTTREESMMTEGELGYNPEDLRFRAFFLSKKKVLEKQIPQCGAYPARPAVRPTCREVFIALDMLFTLIKA